MTSLTHVTQKNRNLRNCLNYELCRLGKSTKPQRHKAPTLIAKVAKCTHVIKIVFKQSSAGVLLLSGGSLVSHT